MRHLTKSRYLKIMVKNVLQFLLGSIFVLSGVLKVVSFESFEDTVAQYSELYISVVLVSMRETLAFIVCVVELIVGVASFFSRIKETVSILIFVILTFFLYLTAVNLFFPDAGGRIESCGCFGDLFTMSSENTFYKNVALWMCSVVNMLFAHSVIKI